MNNTGMNYFTIFKNIIATLLIGFTLTTIANLIANYIFNQKRYITVLNWQNYIYKVRKSIIHNQYEQKECPICYSSGTFFRINCDHIICPTCFRKHTKCPICSVCSKYINEKTVPKNLHKFWGYMIYKLLHIKKMFPEFNWDIENFTNYNYRYPLDNILHNNIAGMRDNMKVDISEIFS